METTRLVGPDLPVELRDCRTLDVVQVPDPLDPTLTQRDAALFSITAVQAYLDCKNTVAGLVLVVDSFNASIESPET